MPVSWRTLPAQPLVLGHRGARHAHPENTLRAFQAALDEGAVGTEFDVVLSADGVPMVFHDFDLRRMTAGRDRRRTRDLTARELEAITLPEGERIPRLEEVLNWAVRTDALLNIELKSEQPLRDPVADVVANMLQRYPSAPDFALLSSFHPTLVRRFVTLQRDVGGAFLVDKNHPCLVNASWLRACKARAIHPHADLILRRPDLLKRVPGALVNSWTVNDEQRAVALAELGVHGIISDRPGAILSALRGLPGHSTVKQTAS